MAKVQNGESHCCILAVLHSPLNYPPLSQHKLVVHLLKLCKLCEEFAN